ncbi:MAG: hypothetical protein HKO81_07025 [Flavobacteriaceae bacterium]|nr:hypothetical protein [Bacteroidia bacterium]NNL16376.1 hypothetical protein [Flavobacteriaceae bacterium]
MKPKLLITLLLVISFLSCKKEAKQNVSKTSETEEISLLDTLTLKLDNGKKWVVNDETQIGISKMDSLITAFKSADKKDYSNLGKDLSIQTGYIIRSCNMTGEAHDQLHVVLVPMLDKISTLKESQDTKKSKAALIELEGIVAAYFKHFEI